MQTVYHTHPNNFCPNCKETGGEHPLAPLNFWCMATRCETPRKMCEYVKHGGRRP